MENNDQPATGNPEIQAENATSIVQKITDMMKNNSSSAAPQTSSAPNQGPPYDFSKTHLHIGIPCYGGMVSEPTMTSLIKFVYLKDP